MSKGGDATASPQDPVLVDADGVTVRLSDYDLGLVMGRLLGAETSPETLASPQFQRGHLLRTARRILTRDEAKARGLMATPAARLSAFEQHPPLQAIQQMEPAARAARLRELGTDEAALEALIEEVTLAAQLQSALLAELDDNGLWQRYEQSHSRVRLDVAQLLNVPTSDEISEAVRTRADAIKEYYRRNPGRYHTPSRAVVRRVVIASQADASDEERAQAKAQAEALRRRALSEDISELARRYSAGPEAEKGGAMPAVSKAQLPVAFTMQVGDISPVSLGPGGYFFFRLDELLPQQVRPLDRSLEREIASQLIQSDGPAPSVAAVARAVRDAWRAGDVAQAEALVRGQHGEVYHTELFAKGGQYRVPGIGTLTNVQPAAFALTLQAPVLEQPILDGEYVWVVRLLEREEPDRLRFQAEKTAFRAAVEQAEKGRVVERLVGSKLPANVPMLLREVQRHYGVLRQDGTIAPVQ